MEEADGIIILSLKQIGVKLDDVKSLKEFTVDHLVESVARGVRVIDASRELPTTLPKEMSGRYRIGSALAVACTELGYRGELGYHQFLYPSDAETRRILLWLLEAMPKMNRKEESEAAAGALLLLSRAVAAEAAALTKEAWAPPLAQPNALFQSTAKGSSSWHYRSARSFHNLSTVPLASPTFHGQVTRPVAKDVRKYYEGAFSPLVTAQCPLKRDVAPSLVAANSTELALAADWDAEWNRHGLQSGLQREEYLQRKKNKLRALMGEQLKSAMQRVAREDAAALDRRSNEHLKSITSRFSNQAKFAQEEAAPAAAAGESEEDIAARRAAELQELRDRLADLTGQISELERNTEGYEANIKQLETRLNEERSLKDELETAYKVKKRVLDLLADPDGSIKMLNEQLDTASAQLVALASQWETRRVQLVARHRELAAERSSRMSGSQAKLARIHEMRSQMKSLAEDARERNEFYKALVEEYERLPKDNQRTQYTERIMEIVNNVKKQNREIEKVLEDTRSVQKEISQLMATLDRSYTATDELIYRDAKINEFSKKCYKLLVSIHELFAQLIKVVEETGQLKNIGRDLEDKIDQLTTAKTTQNLSKITEDLSMVQKENLDLQAAIKKKTIGM